MSQATDDLHHKRQELEQLVGRSERAGLRRGVIIALLLAAAGGGAWWWTQQQQRAQREPDALQWEKAVVDRGDMVMTATATGNLRPKSQVDIGAEVSGRIASVEVTFNDRVKAGQVLARFDTELLDQALDQARRAMAVDQAGLKRAQANLAEARANQARVKALAARGAAAASELDAVLAQVQRAQAEVESAQAQIRVAQLRVAQAQTNLSRAIITSPIDGVVLQRNVEPGNTVAASLQSPNLFILAQDLRKMELHVAVDEADVGMVQADQQATFTVDAHPDQTFKARVLLVHLFPATLNNVVTYTAVLEVDNDQELLKPGMTAMATITTRTRQGTLRVPNAALRFRPRRAQDNSSANPLSFLTNRRPPGMGGGPGGGRGASQEGSTLWVLRQGKPTRQPVRIGRSDGQFTELLSEELKEGDEVLVGQRRARP